MTGSGKRPRRRVAVAAIGLGAILAAVVPAGLALGQASVPLSLGVDIESPATLVARGAAVSVALDVVCTEGAQGDVYVIVSERVGSSTATGGGTASFTCTGTNQLVTVLVQGDNGKSFRKGTASVAADAYAYGDEQYTSKSTAEVISIVR